MSEGHGGVAGNGAKYYQGFQQADMSAQKESLYRQSMNASSAGQIAAVPSRVSESMFHDIANRFEFMGQLIRRLEAVAGRACAPQPCGTGVDTPSQPMPDTLHDKLCEALRILDQANSRISIAVERLESFV